MPSLEERIEKLLELSHKINISDYTDQEAEQHYMMSFGGNKSYRFYAIRYTIQSETAAALTSSSSYIRKWAELLQGNLKPDYPS